MIGALGRAQTLTGLEIHAFVFTSNHYHLLASPESPKQLVDFMRHRPEEPKRSPAPRFHAASQEAWLEMREALQIFTEAFRIAADLLKTGRASPRFPPGSFPPNLPYVPALVPE